MEHQQQSDRSVTNFSIENLLKKDQKKPLNAVPANPWIPHMPTILFKPKVFQVPPPRPIYPPTSPIHPAAFLKAPEFLHCDIRSFASGSTAPADFLHFNNNVLSVNNYNYYFDNQHRLNYLNHDSKPSVSGTAEHVLIKEENQKCAICDKVFENLDSLEQHEKSHKSPRYECNECGKGFSQLRNFKYHISVHRGTKEFAAKCPECGKMFNDKGYLSSHMKIHRNKKEYECPHCPKSFNQRVAFNMHIRIHTGT